MRTDVLLVAAFPEPCRRLVGRPCGGSMRATYLINWSMRATPSPNSLVNEGDIQRGWQHPHAKPHTHYHRYFYTCYMIPVILGKKSWAPQSCCQGESDTRPHSRPTSQTRPMLATASSWARPGRATVTPRRGAARRRHGPAEGLLMIITGMIIITRPMLATASTARFL